MPGPTSALITGTLVGMSRSTATSLSEIITTTITDSKISTPTESIAFSDSTSIPGAAASSEQGVPYSTDSTPSESRTSRSIDTGCSAQENGETVCQAHTSTVASNISSSTSSGNEATLPAEMTPTGPPSSTNLALNSEAFGSTAATTPTQSLPVSSSTPSIAAQGLSVAAVAGAAVGCFILGALLSGLIAFMLLRKQSRRDKYVSPNAYASSESPPYGGEKALPLVSIASTTSFEFLPQQAEDAEVRRRILTIIDQIDQHVENFYINLNVPVDAELKNELARFETAQMSQPLAVCFESSSDPAMLIKHCLTFHIFNLTLAPGKGTQPLLPPELAAMVAAVYHKGLSTTTSKEAITAFSTWKTLTRFLRPDLDRDIGNSRSTNDNAVRIATHFSNVFSPWSNPRFTSERRVQHLTELVNHAVRTAIWLFGQPDHYNVDWNLHKSGTSSGNDIVIVPAVWKTTFDGMRLNGSGQIVLKQDVQQF